MRQVLRGLPALAVALAISSCAGNDDTLPLADSPLPTADRQIAAALYAGVPRTPAGFLTDTPPPSFAQVTTSHIKSSQVAVPAATPHELCTDDWNVALAWSEEVAAQATPYPDLVANEATVRYFEFGRVPRGQPDRYVRMRVFRCAYLDRTGVDAASADGFAGLFNHRPLAAPELRDLSEYLWLFTLYNNADHAVLASEARSPGLAHALTIASLERAAGGAAVCDRVIVREWVHSAHATTGLLELATSVVREFGVRRESGAILGC